MNKARIGLIAVMALIGAWLSLLPTYALLFSGGGATACWTVGSDGWVVHCSTPITNAGTCDNGGTGTANGTCFITIANAGNDGTCSAWTTQAAAVASPCQHIGIASTMLRNGSPDWLLLKKGDTWTVPDIGAGTQLDYFGTVNGSLCRNGPSATQPILISVYGAGARPLLQFSNVSSGDEKRIFNGNNNQGNPCAITSLVISGIEFYDYRADPNNAAFTTTAISPSFTSWISVLNFPTDRDPLLILEDNKTRYLGSNINNLQSLLLIRNVILDAYSIGMFSGNNEITDGINSVYAEGNFFNHNGWTENATVLATFPSLARNTFNHNTYFQWSQTYPQIGVWKNNISLNASDTGLRARQGGLFDNNLLVGNSTGIDWGEGFTSRICSCQAPPISPGVNAVTKNVVMDNQFVPPGTSPDGAGIQMLGIAETAIATGNLTAHIHASATGGSGITLGPDSLGVTATGNVVCDFFSTTVVDNGSGNVTTPNVTQASCTGTGPDPTRSVARYDSEVLGGPGTLADFIAQASNQSKDTWNPALTAPAVNAWIRPGYGLAP